MKRFGIQYFQRFPIQINGKISYKMMIWNRIFWDRIEEERLYFKIFGENKDKDLLELMPQIISFALFGIALGLLKQFGKKLR